MCALVVIFKGELWAKHSSFNLIHTLGHARLNPAIRIIIDRRLSLRCSLLQMLLEGETWKFYTERKICSNNSLSSGSCNKKTVV